MHVADAGDEGAEHGANSLERHVLLLDRREQVAVGHVHHDAVDVIGVAELGGVGCPTRGELLPFDLLDRRALAVAREEDRHDKLRVEAVARALLALTHWSA